MTEELQTLGFAQACGVSEVPDLMPRKVMVGGRALLVCRDTQEDGSVLFYTVDELCPHKMESMAYGFVHEGKIVCPHHQYTFDLETGRCSQRRCAPVDVYETKVVEDHVWVKVPSRPNEGVQG